MKKSKENNFWLTWLDQDVDSSLIKEKEVIYELVQPQTIKEPAFGEEISDTTFADEDPIPEALIELFLENLARQSKPNNRNL